MSTVELTGSRPRSATGRGSLLGAELLRLRHRRLVVALVLVALAALVAAMAAVFFTHSTDVAGAQAKARQQATRATADQKQFRAQCQADPSIPQADKANGACGPAGADATVPPEAFFTDPRLRADQGLPVIAIGIGVGGALLAALVAATAVGADWSSRAIITLLTWEPRRLRLLAHRLLAVAILAAVVGVVLQLVGLGLGALTVTFRGTWQATPAPVESSDGPQYSGPPSSALIGQAHFWRDLLSLEARAIALMVVVAVIAAAVATVTRSTGGLLGVAFGWFAVVEVAVRALFGSRGYTRWLLTDNIAAFLNPGGIDVYAGEKITATGPVSRMIHVSNLEAIAYLGAIAVVLALLAGVFLRRRDL